MGIIDLERHGVDESKKNEKSNPEVKVGDSMIMEPHELSAWLEEGGIKNYILMNKSTEPRNKLNGVIIKILEIKSDNLTLSIDGQEEKVEIPKILFETYRKAHQN